MKYFIALFAVALLVTACGGSEVQEQSNEAEVPEEDLESLDAELAELDNLDQELNLDAELEELDLSLE